MKAPDFNYETLKGIEVGTEEYGQATVKMQIDYMIKAIVWGLECHVIGQSEGKIPPDKGCEQRLLEITVIQMAEYKDKRMYELMLNKTKDDKLIADEMFGLALRHLVDKGAVVYNSEDGTIMPTWCDKDNPPHQDPEDDVELQTRTIDSVQYPLAATFSPTQMLFFTENQDAFNLMYPNGRYESVRDTGRHLREGLVYGTKHKVGDTHNWLYTIRAEAANIV